MLLTRWIKHHHFMNNNTRKYLGYAAGEIVLVIVGILIALQIDAWYGNKQIIRDLNTQLRAIAESISQDIASVTRLKQQRTDSIFGSNRLNMSTGAPDLAESWYNRDYVAFASNLTAISQEPVYFVANTGAHRTIESSGYINHISDDSLRRNLHDYYATVERIIFVEREMSTFVNEVTLKYQTETTQGFPTYLLQEPLFAWQPQDTDDNEVFRRNFREAYRRLLQDSVTLALIRSGRNQPLLKDYEHLLSLGNVLLAQIDSFVQRRQYASTDGEVFHADGLTGSPRVIHQGRFEAHSLGLFSAGFPDPTKEGEDIYRVRMEHDHLTVNYPGDKDWYFVYALVGPLDVSFRRKSLDYSRFDRIRLELKRNSGCEDLRLVLKDLSDANDGSQANVSLTLSDQWETYDYTLSLFSDAELRQLHVPSGFLMGNACSFSVRDVTFLGPEDA